MSAKTHSTSKDITDQRRTSLTALEAHLDLIPSSVWRGRKSGGARRGKRSGAGWGRTVEDGGEPDANSKKEDTGQTNMSFSKDIPPVFSKAFFSFALM